MSALLSALTYLSCLLLYLPSRLVQEEKRVVVHDRDGRVKGEGNVEECLVYSGHWSVGLHFSFSLFLLYPGSPGTEFAIPNLCHK